MTIDTYLEWQQLLSRDRSQLFEASRTLSWQIHGKQVKYFIPGQMFFMGDRGKYPSISLTGTWCALNCDHCFRKILEGMISATEPQQLREICQKLDAEGNLGVLLSGGADKSGALPWQKFLTSIEWIKQNTRLKISIHTGLIDIETAKALKSAGVDEALIDVIGAEETLHQVYHLPITLEAMESSLNALAAAQLSLSPHIVVGLHYGRFLGELTALEMVARYPISALVIVVLNPMNGTPMQGIRPPEPEKVVRFIAASRLRMPEVPIALSCARPPGRHRMETDLLALEAGINRIAMPSEGAIKKAREMGLEIEFCRTCCSNS